MKNFVAAALCLLLIVQKSKAQFSGTDQSTSQKSWEQVLKIASDQKKFILLYGSTRNGISETIVQEQIFSRPSVVNLLNDNFICFKVSLDSNSEKKGSSQEKLAQNIKAQFRQAPLPLFLFYSPEGTLVHAGAGQARETDFLALAKNALDSSKQYFTQLAKFRKGEFSYDKLPYLITVSQNLNGHSTGREMANAYLDYVYKLPVSEQLTTGRLMLMKQYVQNSQDKGFILFKQHAQEIDKIMHQKGFAANMIIDIIQKETITPFLNNGLKAKNTTPNWQLLQQTARKKYGNTHADMAVLNEQIDWYINKRQFSTAARYYFERIKFGYDTSAYGKMFVNNFLYTFLFRKVEEKELLQSGVALIKELLATNPNKASWLDTYASLLYKLGHKDEAIAIEEKALKAEPTDEEIAETYRRMKRGEQIWISKVTYHDSPLSTRWGKNLTISTPLSEYPRPQLRRLNWINLNGQWDYSITDSSLQTASYNDKILVPFPIESKLSGVQKGLLPDQKLWYRRTFELPAINPSKKYLLHFGAVDYQATVWVNDQLIGDHTGGYQSFTMDITRALKKGKNKLTVAVLDPTDKGDNPRGKQSLNPRGILYTPTSGIWQTVWMEEVPLQYIEGLKVTPDIDGSKIHLEIAANGAENGYTVQTVVSANGKIVAQINNALGAIDVQIPSPRLWSPDDPFLYDLSVRLHYKGKLIDSVASYFGMRKIDIQKDSQGQARIFLNNKYTFNLGVLDQGFWPDGLYTAPSDSALRWDIEVMKKMGFNTLRKHIKIEPDRWYYWCDKLGMLVWQDMPMPAGLGATAKSIFERECNINIEQLYNHPSIICWVLFNEGWNRYDQARLTAWMQQKDPSRLINGHSGENYDRNAPSDPKDKWANSDMADIHDYPGPDMPPVITDKALVLGEWGGIRVATPGHQWKADGSWGYIESDKADFARKYQFMMRHLKLFEEEGLSGAIYTQPFDVEIEENGLITYDREVIKIPIEKVSKINRVIDKEVHSEQTYTNSLKR